MGKHHTVRHILHLGNISKSHPVVLNNEKTKHLFKVLRLDEGSTVIVTNGMGKSFLAKIEKDNQLARLMIEDELKTDPKPRQVTLWIGLSKNNTMDWIVEKATELGASKVIPVVCSRSVVRPHSSEINKYETRWQTIANQALEQSERTWLTEVSAPINWNEFVGAARGIEDSSKFAFLSETRASEDDVNSIKKAHQKISSSATEQTHLLIGPEGGFSEDEVQEILRLKFMSLSFGKAVLRVETAVMSALTIARLV